MKLKLWDVEDIILPCAFDYNERLSLVSDILEQYPDNFIYTGIEKTDKTIKVRLDILGTYLLDAVKDIRQDVLSRYKIKRRVYQERPVSTVFGLEGIHVYDKFYAN